MNGTVSALALAAVTVGGLHSLAPDHWVPFAAIARARRWSAARTAVVTLLCGFGHVTTSALLGLLGLFFGRQLFETFGRRMETWAGYLLIGFGLVYAAWGLRRVVGRRWHGHAHSHYDHIHDTETMTSTALFLLFAADPCVAVIPILFAAAPFGLAPAAGIVLLYEVATLAAMIGLVLPATAGVRRLRLGWLDHYGDAAAGAMIVVVGVAVTALGW